MKINILTLLYIVEFTINVQNDNPQPQYKFWNVCPTKVMSRGLKSEDAVAQILNNYD